MVNIDDGDSAPSIMVNIDDGDSAPSIMVNIDDGDSAPSIMVNIDDGDSAPSIMVNIAVAGTSNSAAKLIRPVIVIGDDNDEEAEEVAIQTSERTERERVDEKECEEDI